MTSTTTFVQNLEAFFKKEEAVVVKYATELLPKLENAVEVAFQDLADIAGGAVLAELPKLISGSEKFGNAVASVVQTVEAQGKTVVLATAQAAVQTAYLTAVDVATGK